VKELLLILSQSSSVEFTGTSPAQVAQMPAELEAGEAEVRVHFGQQVSLPEKTRIIE